MPLKTQFDEMPNLNLTSMIDVVFLLIIFFMAGTRFAEEERQIALEVPKVNERAALAPAAEKHVVNVYRDGEVALDGRTLSLTELTTELTHARREQSGIGVLVRGDSTGQFQHVADVLNACKEAGIAELAISVQVDGRRR